MTLTIDLPDEQTLVLKAKAQAKALLRNNISIH